jgi:hypothetical protein
VCASFRRLSSGHKTTASINPAGSWRTRSLLRVDASQAVLFDFILLLIGGVVIWAVWSTQRSAQRQREAAAERQRQWAPAEAARQRRAWQLWRWHKGPRSIVASPTLTGLLRSGRAKLAEVDTAVMALQPVESMFSWSRS